MSSSQPSGSSSHDATDYLRSASFSTGSSAVGGDNDAVTASDLLADGFDPSRLHPMAGIKDQLEYLQLDDDKLTDLPGATTALPSRGWSDDLCYGTGTTYLSGPYLSSLLTRPRLRPYCSVFIGTVLTRFELRACHRWTMGCPRGLEAPHCCFKCTPAYQCHPQFRDQTRNIHWQFSRCHRCVTLAKVLPLLCPGWLIRLPILFRRSSRVQRD